MYVCICNALTERQVDAAIDRGADKADDVYAAHGCAAQCGKCIRDVEERIACPRSRKLQMLPTLTLA